MKVVINARYGGFGLSDQAVEYIKSRGGDANKWDNDHIRSDPLLIECVETLGQRASGAYSKLKIVDIPDDIEWDIEEYDGFEHVAEAHRVWS